MGFVQTFEEIIKMARETYDFYEAEMLMLAWETRLEVARRLLPPPLEPAERPVALAFLANYPETNFSGPYNEGALLLQAGFKGEPGYYCLSMPVSDDYAMAGGREQFGYPKKLARIALRRAGNEVWGMIERRGINFFCASATLDGEDACPEMGQIAAQAASEQGMTVFNFKHFMDPGGANFDYKPRLVSGKVVMRPRITEFGRGKVIITHSEYDPWSEVEVVRMLGAVYTVGDNSMLKGKVTAEVEPAAFMQYAFLKWDVPYLAARETRQPAGAG